MLEGYIAPLFTGYVDKYIKNLKPGDLSLSLWGGDVVLQNLELNLDVLQKELNLPVTFLSGKIHKFQLHVPWTRLIYEPVVVTIDTMEFIVKLRDSSEQSKPDEEKETGSSSNLPTQPTVSENMPPGYVQGILNKVINNVSFKINNIIIKYVEDDIVLSLNVKSVDFFCANADWERSFIDLALPELLLRKICNITDLTVCLDQRNTSGRIELYQDPVLYKCNLSCRIISRYKGLGSAKPVETKVNLFCEQFDFSLTDLQIPIVLRLLKLVIGLYYGTLDLPGCNVKKHTAPTIIEKHKNSSSINLSALAAENKEPDSSWTSWALSMIPGGGEETVDETSFKENINFCFGLYVTQTTLTLKATNHSLNVISSQRMEFTPIINFELGGCIMEFVAIGDILIDVNLGVNFLLGYLVGSKCVCQLENANLREAVSEDQNSIEDTIFLKVGPYKTKEQPLDFLQNSLFTDYLPIIPSHDDAENQSPEQMISASNLKDNFSTDDETTSKAVLHDILVANIKSGSQLDKEEIQETYGSLFMNYFYEMTLPDTTAGDIENIFLFPNTDEVVPEKSEKRFFISSFQFILSTSFFHAVNWLTEICGQKLPQRKEKVGVTYDPFVVQQLQLGNFLSRKSSFEISNSSLYVLTNDHKAGEKQSRQVLQEEIEALCVQVEDAQIVKIDPMYPLELTAMLDQGKIVKLNHVENMDSRIFVNVGGLQSGLSVINMDSLEAFTLPIIPPVNFEVNFKSTLMTDKPDVEMSVLRTQCSVKCEEINVMFTKLHLLLYYYIAQSWMNESLRRRSHINSLTYSVFHPEGSPDKKVPLMNFQIKDCYFNMLDLSNLYCVTANVGEINASLQGVGDGGGIDNVPLFQIPASTSKLAHVNTWLGLGSDTTVNKDHAIQFRLQFHKGKSSEVQLLSIKVSGATLNVDVMVYNWINHKPTQHSRKEKAPLVSQRSRPSLLITTPKRAKSYARMYAAGSTTSPSHHSKEKFKAKNQAHNANASTETSLEQWVIEKINLLKAFNIKVEIGAFVLFLPDKKWSKDLLVSGSIVEMVSCAYQRKNIQHHSNSSLVVCLPKISVNSSHPKPNIFEESLPVSHPTLVHDTLPWTITVEDFAILTLFPDFDQANLDQKVETIYICRPVSCKVLLAASSTGHIVSRTSKNLGSISEQSVNIESSSLFKSPERLKSDKKATIGFVLHADWSVCEWFINQNQLKLLVNVSHNVYESFNEFQCNFYKNTTALIKETPSTEKRSAKELDTTRSVSSASTIDLPDNFSTFTGSSNVSTKKVHHKEVAASLWIQCTFPKVRVSILSDTKQPSCYNQITSEIDEFMLAFDYQDNTLELTNKVSSLVVYYSVLRFDRDPYGWVDVKNGFIFCQKEKFESSRITSKTFLSLVYHRSREVAQTAIQTIEHSRSGDQDTVTSGTPVLEEELVIKHELNVRIQSFDIVCIASPILSSIHIFTRSIKNFVSGLKRKPTSQPQSTTPANDPKLRRIYGSSIITWPMVSVNCGNIRLIMPQGEATGVNIVEDIDEPVLLFHLHSIDLTSSPVNPVTKTVVDKPLYKYLKQCYRDPLKKLKLWNVQYQVDIHNVGLCTTNWQSIQSTISNGKHMVGSRDGTQNPALEWNMQSNYEQPKLTPIFDGFDLKSTIAPPLCCYMKTELRFGTSAAVEFHSPRPIKLYINSSQIILSLQLFEEVNSLIMEMTSILDIGTNYLLAEDQDSVFESPPNQETLGNPKSLSRMNSSSSHFPPVECFGSISSISLDLYRRSKSESGSHSINPVLLLVLVQPTCSLNTVHSSNFQFTLLDMGVTTSSKTVSNELFIPTVNDYDVRVLSCGTGEMDENTGLLPPLLKTSVTLPSSIDLFHIGKSIAIQVEQSLILNISKFMENLSPIFEGKSQERDQVEPVTSSRRFNLTDVHFTTKQIHFMLSASTSSVKTAFDAKWHGFDSTVKLTYDSKNTLEDLHFDGVLNGIEFGLCNENSYVPVLKPTKMEFEVMVGLTMHTGRSVSETCVWLRSGIINLCIYQELYELVNVVSDEVSQCLAQLPSSNTKRENVEEEEELLALTIQNSYDDLRNGSFSYVLTKDPQMDDIEAMQIIFSNEDDHVTPIMSWRYSEPRIITQIHVLPVPFYMPKNLQGEWNSDILKVECYLQFWDRLSKNYITCGMFCLSENDASTIVLCNENLLPFTVFHQSDRWRVVIATNQNIANFGLPFDSKKELLAISPVPATSLAACLKVDSIECVDVRPTFELKTMVKQMKINVCNNENNLLTDPPEPFKLYYLNNETSIPDSTEVISLMLSDLNTNLSLSPKTRVDITLKNTLEVAVMDFSNLCWVDLLTRTLVDLKIQKALTQTPAKNIDKETRVDLQIDEADVLITQSAVHTLFLTQLSWSSMMNGKKECHFLNHFILCNGTQDSLRIQQVDTDEDIVLESGQMHPYSWYSHKNQFIRFCMVDIGDWKWSDSIDILKEGVFEHHLEHKTITSKLLVEVRKIGGIQRQVIFHGCCTFINNLRSDINVEVITQEAKNPIGNFQNFVDVSKRFVLPSGVERPSFTTSSDYIKQFRLYGAGSIGEKEIEEKGNECCQIFFPQNNHDTDICAKVKTSQSWAWLWVSIRENKSLPGQLVISFNPFFVLRNHLSEKVLLRFTARDQSNETQDVVAMEKGVETEVLTLDPDRWFLLNVGIPGSEEFSKQPYTINTTMRKMLRDNESNCNEMLNSDRWPYYQDMEKLNSKPSTILKTSYKATVPSHAVHSTKKNLEESKLTFQSSLKWPSLPTVLIDLKPQILICNLTCLSISVRDDNIGCSYMLAPSSSLSPFFIKESLSVSIENNQKKQIWSKAINLSLNSTNNTKDGLQPGSTSHVVIFDDNDMICHQVTIKLIERDGIYVVTFKERFLFHNLSSHYLKMCPMMFQHINLSQTLNEGMGYLVAPGGVHPFAKLNLLKNADVDNKNLDGLAINCNVLDERGDTSSDILLENHLVRKRDSIILSEDHLRECICLTDINGDSKPFVLTSSLNDGVISVFIAEERYSVVNIRNHCSVMMAMREDLSTKTKERYHILEKNADKLVLLKPGKVAHHFPSEFKANFPKPTNNLEIHAQFALYSAGTVELSNPILVNKDTSTKLFIPGYGHAFICGYIQNSRLFVEILKEEKLKSELVYKRPLSLPNFKVNLSSLDIIFIDTETNKKLNPLISTSLSSLQLTHDVGERSAFKFSLGSVQIDNQIQEDNCYHFPVILLPMRELSQRYHTIATDAPFPEIEACSEADLFTVTIVINQHDCEDETTTYVESIKIQMQPCEMFLEDMLVYRLAQVMETYVPVWVKKRDLEVASSLVDSAKSILFPVMVCNVEVAEISVLLSVHASVKVFVAADHIPLILGRFTCDPTQTVRDEMTRVVLYHYATQVLVRVGWILGSLEIIGNPTGFIRSVARGLSDFFTLPYQGLTRGPTAFVSGISQGISSFFRHVSTGTLTSITNVSSSMSRNLDRLCLDETHFRIQEERRAQIPTRTSSGLQNAFGSLGISLLGAVAGLVDHPIQNISTANTAREAVTGMVTGFAKGVVGVVTKPLGGAMEFVSQTSQGILQGTGLVKVPERLNFLEFGDATEIGRRESQTKFMWQHLHIRSQDNIYIAECVAQPHNKSLNDAAEGNDEKCWVAVTPQAVFVFNGATNHIQSAFPLNEVSLTRRDEQENSILCLLKNSADLHFNASRSISLDENPNFRQFFESFHAASLSTQAETMYDEISVDELVVFQCLVNMHDADLLVLYFKVNKALLHHQIDAHVEL